MVELSNFGVVILAAGESSRMSYPKPLLRYDSRRRFIDKIIDEYRYFGINNIVIVVNNQIHPKLNLSENISVVVNEHLEYERFYSIKLGLEKVQDCEFCFIQNTDNPFVNEVILRKLYYRRNIEGSTVPVCDDRGGHPVIINRKIMNKIRETNGSILNFKDFINEFPCNRVAVDDESVLININTNEDYKKYFN